VFGEDGMEELAVGRRNLSNWREQQFFRATWMGSSSIVTGSGAIATGSGAIVTEDGA
jgi:hypothetical protein